MGLRWAFTMAGALTVVTSMWQVPDAATRDLMVAFYRAMLDGATAVQALHAAQREIRAARPDPYYWAAFVLHGNPAIGLV